MTAQRPDEITVDDNPDKHRFDIRADGIPAGFSMYQDIEGADAPQRIFFHTVIFDEFEGKGLAGILTRSALDTSISAGLRIVAVCPYVKKWLATHDGYEASVDPVRPQHLRAIR